MKKHIPNAITCCNLISGCVATFFAFERMYEMALLFIIIGAVFDFFDGMSARLLRVSSPIGKELDSLADDVTFGVAPSSIVFAFLSSQHLHVTLLPFLAFLIAAFSALRLAKFNLDERQTTSFIGLPTPANALFWGAVIQWLHWQEMFEPYQLPAYYIYIVVALIPLSCYLLVAEIPLFALKFKQWGWKGNEVKYVFVATSALILLVLGIIGIAAVIAWYVLLSVVTQRRESTHALSLNLSKINAKRLAFKSMKLLIGIPIIMLAVLAVVLLAVLFFVLRMVLKVRKYMRGDFTDEEVERLSKKYHRDGGYHF